MSIALRGESFWHFDLLVANEGNLIKNERVFGHPPVSDFEKDSGIDYHIENIGVTASYRG